jgi:SAM-dependent methyltransferase
MALPEVMGWINLKVAGREEIWPLSWFLLSLAPQELPVDRALSIGCGPGNLEREVMRHEAAREIWGIDVSEGSIQVARREAEASGYGSKIHYEVADAARYLEALAEEECFDLVFFHASLHHVEALEPVLLRCGRILKSGKPGLLYVDEYVGPSRDEWQATHLGYANGVFERVPEEFRRWKELRPPVAYDDPTEMVRSSEIGSALEENFEIIAYKPYFGNVVMPLVSGILPAGLEDNRVKKVIREAMDLEDHLARRGLIDPFYAVFVARPFGST